MGSSQQLYLPPRLMQPARLSINWLNNKGQGINDSNPVPLIENIPVLNPICGWVIANNLDQSLMIYHQSGKIIGQIMEHNQSIVFKKFPEQTSTDQTKDVNAIENKALKQLVLGFLGKADKISYFKDFHHTINQSLEYIDPESFEQHKQYALFANRPVALVRCRIDMETATSYQSDHSRTTLKEEIKQGKKITHGYENIEFPITLGNYQSSNNGVIGYWKSEVPTGKFHAVVSSIESQTGNIINMSEGDNLMKNSLMTSLESDPQDVSLLMDIRGDLSVISRVLPTQSSSIHSIYFKEALTNIQMVFRNSAIISPPNKIHLPLMRDTSLTWEWWQKENKQDAPISIKQQLNITETAFNAGLAEILGKDEQLSDEYKELKKNAWTGLKEDPESCLKPFGDNEAYEVLLDQLNLKGKPLQAYQSILLMVLENYSKGILPPIMHGHLSVQEIRDGWLQLNSK